MLDTPVTPPGPYDSSADTLTVSPIQQSRTPLKAKILHVVNGEHYSGAERVQDLLGNRLPGLGYEVSFACVKPKLFPEKRKHKQVAIYETPMRNRVDLFAAAKIGDLIREHEFKMVHAHTPRSALVGAMAAKKWGVPFVFHVHSPTSRDSTRKVINWFNQRVENWSIRNAAKIITVSNSLKEHMVELGFEDSKITVVPNGVPMQDDPIYSVSDDPFVIGTVALFRPRKGTEILLEAVAKLKRQYNVKVLAVGPFETEEYEKHLKALVRELEIEDQVAWTGFTTNVDAQFSRMNLFCLPSLFGEGLPMVVLEAMSHRVPVVASNVEGIPQAVRDGVDGLIAEAGDAADLADKIQSLIEERKLCETMSENAFDRQQQQFSDWSMARGLAQVYDELLA